MAAAVAGAVEFIAMTRPSKVAVVILRHLYMPQEQRNGLSVPRWKLPWDEKIDHGGLA